MRLITFVTPDNALHVGAVSDDKIVDLTAAIGVHSVKELLSDTSSSTLERSANAASTRAADFSIGDVTLERPLTHPTRVFCIGVNYMNRNEEYKDDSKAPAYPSIFMRSGFSFTAHEQPLIIPPESEQFDYEGEIVLVIGKPGRRITQAQAHSHIAGLTIMNEGSVRDWLRHGKFNVTQGKNFDSSGSLGPWIETDLTAINLTDMTVTTTVNGEVRQHDTTASMAFPFARIIEYISTFTCLQPGDIIATGTPTGSGARFDPPRWLVAGDRVEVAVQGVGVLSNTVKKE